MKKIISVMLATLMLASTMSATIVAAEEVAEPVYVVAGTASLCGVEWKGSPADAEDNIMTLSDDVYTKVFENVPVGKDYSLKVVENDAEGNQNWIGDATGNNVVFNVENAACDVTVAFNPGTKEITVTGDNVTFTTELEINAMYAVGNGAEGDAWLNGVEWNQKAEANMMTEVSDKVYEITFSDVEGPFDGYQVKFAANGEWTDNWAGTFVASGEAFDAVYNAANNTVVTVPYEIADVTLTLDLTSFDYATKTGGKVTITIVDKTETEPEETTAPETEPEETTAPVTEPEETTAPVTEPEETTAPVTEPEETTAPETEPEETTAPVTEPEETTAPVTEPEETTAPETEPEETTAPVAAPVYVVAGVPELCGVEWKGSPADAEANIMVEADGVYTKVFTDVAVGQNYGFKVVENDAEGNQNWIGDATGNNVVFNVENAACDVTVTYNPATGEITVTGDNVTFTTELEINAIYAVGNGAEGDAWLNGVEWNQKAEANMMTEVSDKVYEITFKGVEGPFDGYQVKFAANGEWTHNWGGTFVASGEAFDAEYNAQNNIAVVIPYELADVTLTLDLSAFDFAAKTGAKITVTVEEVKADDVVGDMDGNGDLDVNDVTYLQMSLAGYVDYELPVEVADITGDGFVDVDDVTALQFLLAGIKL